MIPLALYSANSREQRITYSEAAHYSCCEEHCRPSFLDGALLRSAACDPSPHISQIERARPSKITPERGPISSIGDQRNDLPYPYGHWH